MAANGHSKNTSVADRHVMLWCDNWFKVRRLFTFRFGILVRFVDRKILRELAALAVPMVISQGAFALMIFCDRLFLSMVSPLHMAAGLGGGVASFFCLSLFMGTLAYSNALVAQYYGSGELHKCARVLTQSLILSVGFAPLLLILGIVVSFLFEVMGHAPEQVQLERDYFFVLIGGAVLTLFKVSLASFFTGTGKTKVVMFADVVGVALNVPLTYGLIFGAWGMPELGIVGAGIGTIIGNCISLVILLLFYFYRSHRQQYHISEAWHFDRGITRRYLKLGVPSGFEMFLNVAAFNLFLLMFQSYGVAEAASAAIVLNWDIMAFIPMLGLNAAVVSLVGRNVGAADMARVGQVIRSGFVLGLGYTSVVAVLFLVLRGPLVEVFLNGEPIDAEIRQLSMFMMLGMASYVVADGTIQVAGGSLRGAGDTVWLMKTSITLHWLMLLAQIVVIKVLELGPGASWVVFVLMILALAGSYVWRLMSGGWRTRAISIASGSV